MFIKSMNSTNTEPNNNSNDYCDINDSLRFGCYKTCKSYTLNKYVHQYRLNRI